MKLLVDFIGNGKMPQTPAGGAWKSGCLPSFHHFLYLGQHPPAQFRVVPAACSGGRYRTADGQMEWTGMEWNGMEWKRRKGQMEWNGMEWNGMEWIWNGME